jgi:hypothetical protein
MVFAHPQLFIEKDSSISLWLPVRGAGTDCGRGRAFGDPERRKMEFLYYQVESEKS